MKCETKSNGISLSEQIKYMRHFIARMENDSEYNPAILHELITFEKAVLQSLEQLLVYKFSEVKDFTAQQPAHTCTCESNETHTTLPRKCRHCRRYIMNDANDLLAGVHLVTVCDPKVDDSPLSTGEGPGVRS